LAVHAGHYLYRNGLWQLRIVETANVGDRKIDGGNRRSVDCRESRSNLAVGYTQRIKLGAVELPRNLADCGVASVANPVKNCLDLVAKVRVRPQGRAHKQAALCLRIEFAPDADSQRHYSGQHFFDRKHEQ
jgi:hypothetical protein